MHELTRAMIDGLEVTGPTDPINFYRRPLVGWLFRERINLGLRLLGDRTFERALEVGYGAGAVQLALASSVKELHGIDLDADPRPVERLLEARGHRATLVQGNVYELPYERERFDLVVSFSVFEHLADPRLGLEQVVRVLRPGGLFLLGMPSVNPMMEVGFSAIGFRGIDHHHITTPATVASMFSQVGFSIVDTACLDVPARPPAGLRLYTNWLLRAA